MHIKVEIIEVFNRNIFNLQPSNFINPHTHKKYEKFILVHFS